MGIHRIAADPYHIGLRSGLVGCWAFTLHHTTGRGRSDSRWALALRMTNDEPLALHAASVRLYTFTPPLGTCAVEQQGCAAWVLALAAGCGVV